MEGGTGEHPVDLAVLGPLELRVGDAAVALPARTERALLAALALRRGRPVPADRLAGDVWGDDLPSTWRKGVQVGVSRLRRRLADAHPDGAGLVVTTADGYAVTVGADSLDAARLEQAAEEGRRLLAQGEAEAAHATLRAGLALWRGTPYPELAERAAGQAEAARLTEIRDAATDRWYEATIERGDVDTAIAGLEAALVEDPLRERRWSLLMLALYRAGRQNDALRAFQRARTVLAEELGLDPGPELRHLEGAILAHDPALEAATRQRLVAAGHLAADGSATAPTSGPGGRDLAPPRRDPLGDPLEWARPLTRLPRRGRAAELDHLLDAWGRVAAGQGGMVTLTGDPLSGKSRLAAELALAAEADGALVLAGRCVPGMGLASFVGTAATMDLVPLDDLVPGSAQAFTLGLEVAAMAYEEAARGRPVLAILDDAHHADPEVINLFRHLAERPVAGDAALPAGALVVQRAGRRPPPGMAEWLAQGRRLPVHEDVTVAPLDPGAAAALLADCLGGDESGARGEAHDAFDGLDTVAARAGGRPGYLVELGLHLRRGGAPDEVPPTLRALVESHLDAQDEVVLRVVQAAAVTGPRFDLATATHAAGLDEDTTLDALERAVTARVLDEVEGAPGEHAFCAEVDRLVLLGRLTNARRAVIEGRLQG